MTVSGFPVKKSNEMQRRDGECWQMRFFGKSFGKSENVELWVFLAHPCFSTMVILLTSAMLIIPA